MTRKKSALRTSKKAAKKKAAKKKMTGKPAVSRKRTSKTSNRQATVRRKALAATKKRAATKKSASKKKAVKRKTVKKKTVSTRKKITRGKTRPATKKRGTVKKKAVKKKSAPRKKSAVAKRRKPARSKTATRTSARTSKAGKSPVKTRARMIKPKQAQTLPKASRTYQPKKGEAYMSEQQLTHFSELLLQWKKELMKEVDRTVNHMQTEVTNFADPADRATQEEEFGLELRTRDRERKLIKKIDEALGMIGNEEYGYCNLCGAEIGIRRLEARPTATMCIDCKTMQEHRERQVAD